MNQKKSVLIFSTAYFPLVGGAEVAMKEITDRLPEWDFSLICARIRPGLPDVERVGNVTVYRTGFGKPIDKYLLPIFGVWRALHIEPRGGFQLIWSLMASYGGFAALSYTWVRPKTKMLLTLQEGDPLEHYAKRVGGFRLMHERIFSRANAIQSISRFLADWAKRMGATCEPEVVPNGVDIDRFTARISSDERAHLRAEWGIKEGETILVTTSRLSKKNGINDLILSLRDLPKEFHVVIAGTGEDEAMLRGLVDQHGLGERVRFLGAQPHTALVATLQASDIFIRASLSEGLGNSFLEAMASGLPIVGTPVGGIPDFLEDGQTGVFCQPSDPPSIAKAVLRIQTEPGLADRLKKQGEALVRASYSWDGIASRMDRLLNALWN